MTNATRCHYEVFCPDQAPSAPANKELLAVLGPHAKWSRVTAKTDPNRWAPPKFIIGAAADPHHRPAPVTSAATKTLEGLMKKLGVCFVVTAEGPAGKPTLLQAALGLATAACGEAKGELVVDRTASLAMMPGDVLAQSQLLNKGQLNPADGVTTAVSKTGDLFAVTTAGLCKYGSPEVVLADLAQAEVELAIDLVYGQLLAVAVGGGFAQGQTLNYLPKDPAARLFVAVKDGRARISDCDPKRLAPMPGLKKYAATLGQRTPSKTTSKK